MNIKLSQEEFLKRDYKEFKGKWTFVNLYPGAGKTRKIPYFADGFCLSNDPHLRIVVCMPTHAKIREFLEKKYTTENGKTSSSKPHVAHVHLEGKDQFGICMIEDQLKRRIPGCGRWHDSLGKIHYLCEYSDDCIYLKQFDAARRYNLIFVVKEHLQLAVQKYDPGVIIIDETIESLVVQGVKVPASLAKYVKFRQCICDNCPITKVCPNKDKLDFLKEKYCVYEMFRTIEKFDFEPETLGEYFFKYDLEHLEHIYGIYDNNLKDHIVIAWNDISFLQDVPTLIFNCATTKLSMAEKVFGRKFNDVITSDRKLQNKIYMLDELASIRITGKMIPNLDFYFKLFNIVPDKDFLLYCKKKFKHTIRKKFKEMSVGNYGDSRGYNKYEDCKDVMLFGRYDLRESIKWLLWLYNFNFDESTWIGKAEEMQAFHRVRPMLNKDKRIFLMTNSLKHYFNDIGVKIDILFTRKHLEICKELMDKNFKGLTKTGIHTKIGHEKKGIKKALEILHEFGWINDMNKYGAKLEWMIKK